MSFDWSIVVAYWPRFWSGTLLTLKYAAIAIVIAMVWGILIGALSFRKPKILGPIVRAYICFFRETPLLVQLYFLFYGVSRYVSVSAGMMGVIALVLNDGAFVAEIVRGGLQSIDAGQSGRLCTGLQQVPDNDLFFDPAGAEKGTGLPHQHDLHYHQGYVHADVDHHLRADLSVQSGQHL